MSSKGQRLPSFADKFVSSETHTKLEHLVAPHVESFDYCLETGLTSALRDVPVMQVLLGNKVLISMQILDIRVGHPTKSDNGIDSKLSPREAREGGRTYAGALVASVEITAKDKDTGSAETINIQVKFGELPIMVLSQRCNLKGKSCAEMVAMKEEANEVGGYFIINGIERVIRLLQVPRRNYAAAIERSSYKNRGPSYSDKGVAMRCVRPDQSSITITLHYLNNGGSTLKFVLRKQEFLLPVILVAKSLVDMSDKELFDRMVQGDTGNTFLTTRLELLLRDFKTYKLSSKAQCQAYLGSLFRLYMPITDETTDQEAGIALIDRFFFVHVSSFKDKLECMLHMLRKLLSFAEGKCIPDNADALMNHEILLPGHLVTMIVKEKMEEALLGIRQAIQREYNLNSAVAESDVYQAKYYQKHFDRFGGGVGGKIGTFLSTGNIVSSSGLDLMQVSGYTIVAERLNYLRYMSHFQSVHRGQFFTTMKTTAVRKLLPESWGFLCPVHTPDGSPCGLLNHLAKTAVIVAFPTNERDPVTATGPLARPSEWDLTTINQRPHIQKLLSSLGMIPSGVGAGDGQPIVGHDTLPVLLDGVVIGGLEESLVAEVVKQLRYIKVSGNASTPKHLRLDPTIELAHIPRMAGGVYPGLYMFTSPGRMIRPVVHLGTRNVEWLGPMEQVYMDVACLHTDVREETTHMEQDPTVMLSHVASLTPFSDYNQSPRNMYQCQMGKQTMGTPAHALRHRADNKLYRIQNPQAALVQTAAHREYCMDEYPQGTNAVVAVISYTGYDMEDAMIINKSAYERGFGHGSMYKTTVVDLDDEEQRTLSDGTKPTWFSFSNIKKPPLPSKDEEEGEDDVSKPITGDLIGEKFCEDLDFDGLPFEGVQVQYGDPICCFVDGPTGEHRIMTHKDNEPAYVECVRVVAKGDSKSMNSRGGVTASKRASCRRASITLRYRRNPVIGDKFSSRHGQKGTLSQLWPQENMPFSESGMSPDILINPHAFPSRMTIGKKDTCFMEKYLQRMSIYNVSFIY